MVFSWIEWPDKATRDTAMAKVMSAPRLSPQSNPMPFDRKRMIFAGFSPVVELDAFADLLLASGSAAGIESLP